MLRESLVTFGGTELPHKSLETFGPTTIVAPHPDDETLACGGLVALLHRNKQPVSSLAISALCGIQKGEIQNELASEFPALVKLVRTMLETLNPSTLVIPFRGDSDSDHSATWHIARTAVRQIEHAPRLLEYPMWIGPVTEALLSELQPTVWKLDVSSVASCTHLYEGFFEFRD